MPLCIKENDYNRVLRLMKEELKAVENSMNNIKDGTGSKKNIMKLPELQNLQFELQILIHTFTEFVQYDEHNQLFMVNMTDVNKDRLIGFLLTKAR